MKKALVLFCALALVQAVGQKTVTLPNGNTVATLANGEVWATIHIHEEPLAIQLFPYMPTAGKFQTQIVQNLSESDLVGAPQSVATMIWGDCSTRTYQFMGSVFYEGKMRGGPEDGNGPTPPEGVTRRVRTGSKMEHVFHVVCKATQDAKPDPESSAPSPHNPK